MTKTGLILLGLLVALMVGVIAPTSASAHEFVVAKNPIEAVPAEFFGYQYPFSGSGFESKLAGVEAGIVCTVAISKGNFEKEGKSTGEVKLSDCRVYEYKEGRRILLNACTLPFTGAVIKFKDELPVGEPINDEWEGAEAGKLFGIVEIQVCGLKGKYELTGEQACAWPEPKVEKFIHIFQCDSTGEKELKLDAEPARFWYADVIYLTSRSVWGAK